MALALVTSLVAPGPVHASGTTEVAAQRLVAAPDPDWASGAFSPAELGHSVATGWVVGPGRQTATAQLPGGAGSVRLTVPTVDTVAPASTGHMVRAGTVPVANIRPALPDGRNPSTAGCLTEIPGRPSPQPVVGDVRECGSHEVTVTFDRPTVDPVLWFGPSLLGLGTGGALDTACYLTWHDSTVVSVDGVAPAADRLSLVSTADSLSGFSGGRVGFEFSADPVSCQVVVPTPRGYAGVQVSGLVSSVTVSLDQVVRITRVTPSGDIARSALGQPSFAMTTSADVVDLGVAVSAPVSVTAGGLLEWTVQVANASPVGSHGFVVTGAVPEGVSDASVVDAPPGCVLEGRDLTCAAAPPGWSVGREAETSTRADLTGGNPSSVDEVLAGGSTYGPVILRGTAPETAGAEVVTTATVAGVDSDLQQADNTSRAVTTVEAPVWTVAKTVSNPGESRYPAPGETLAYAVTATSVSGVVDGVVLTDDLTDVFLDADLVPGSVRLAVGASPGEQLPDPTPADPVVVAGPVRLAPGEVATLTYSVVLHEEAWSAGLTNTVTASGSSAPATCASGSPSGDLSCSTSTTTTARLEVLKQGQVNGVLEGIEGAAFEVLADADGVLGAPLATPQVVAVAGRPGWFEIAGIDPGTYWLRETAAPAEHELLAAPVRFEVSPDGGVTVLDGGSGHVVAAGSMLTVTDVPSFALPETGSTSRRPSAVAGALLLGAALFGLGRLAWGPGRARVS